MRVDAHVSLLLIHLNGLLSSVEAFVILLLQSHCCIDPSRLHIRLYTPHSFVYLSLAIGSDELEMFHELSRSAYQEEKRITTKPKESVL